MNSNHSVEASQLVKSVIATWNNAHITHNEGVSLDELNTFEKKHDIRLPSPFRMLYLASDGTGLMDEHQIIFDQLESIDAGYVKKEVDYTSENKESVYILDFEMKELTYLCATFDHFLTIYLHKPAQLTMRFR